MLLWGVNPQPLCIVYSSNCHRSGTVPTPMCVDIWRPFFPCSFYRLLTEAYIYLWPNVKISTSTLHCESTGWVCNYSTNKCQKGGPEIPAQTRSFISLTQHIPHQPYTQALLYLLSKDTGTHIFFLHCHIIQEFIFYCLCFSISIITRNNFRVKYKGFHYKSG